MEEAMHKVLLPSLPIGRAKKMSRKAFAVIIKPLVDLHGEPANWNSKIAIYYDALSDIPEMLLNTAVRHEIGANPYFPKPAELRNCIAYELSMHWRKQRDAQFAALPKPADRPPPTPEDVAHVTEVMTQIRAVLGSRATVMKEV